MAAKAVMSSGRVEHHGLDFGELAGDQAADRVMLPARSVTPDAGEM
jgi:hypothetical protein